MTTPTESLPSVGEEENLSVDRWGPQFGPQVPGWLRSLGQQAWLAVGVFLAVGIVLVFAGAISDLLIPLVFAAILAAIFVPVVDRLERARVPRAAGALLVVIAALTTVISMMWLVLVGVIDAGAVILDQVTAGVDEAGALVDASSGTTQRTVEVVKDLVGTVMNGLLAGLSSATVLVVGVVTGTFILLYLMKDWTLVFRWSAKTAAKLTGISLNDASQILTEGAQSFRRYALGLTVIGIMNGIVVGGAALFLGVPSAGAIGLVTFVTSYVPFFGAFFAGAFAVLIALGANGLSIAIAMLVVTLLANNTLQNLLEPVAFGHTLDLHPLVVLVVTTGGTLLFGVLGATLAAPLTAVTLRAGQILRRDLELSHGVPP